MRNSRVLFGLPQPPGTVVCENETYAAEYLHSLVDKGMKKLKDPDLSPDQRERMVHCVEVVLGVLLRAGL